MRRILEIVLYSDPMLSLNLSLYLFLNLSLGLYLFLNFSLSLDLGLILV